METEFIAWLRQRLPPHPQLLLGPGDDAALLRFSGRPECLVTVDLLTDEVDFRLSESDPRRIGRKALAVNLSDIAAMAGRPLAAVIALALPRTGAFELATKLYEGMLPLAAEYQVALAGGDTNCWDGPLAISVTLLGETTERGPLCRSGARPGDAMVVTGSFGGSILGRHFDFTPRVREALILHQRYELHAAIDVSDGLSLDLARLVNSSGCGARINTSDVPIADAARALAQSDGGTRDALGHALGDGEDFELLLAVPPDIARRMLAEQPLDVPLTLIGEFVTEPGLWQIDAGGDVRPLVPQGWIH
ncbi:MAG TPA: thiamine-phosphate kinase [Pirellulales bacterium]|nr:thiamine-phosphate kinase [Pirellulales bacterium]